MSDEKEPVILDHDYDGIKEYDNPLPNWWLVTFLGTIIFGALYYIHYEISGVAPTLRDELKTAMAVINAKVPTSTQNQMSDEQLAALFEKSKDQVKEIYLGKCAVCHGQNGEGLIGPNLTDNFWINGKGTNSDLVKLISVGVVEKGMPNWDAALKQEEIIAVAAHVHSLHGTKPANAKPPQGNEVK